jgi:hypothetical protein
MTPLKISPFDAEFNSASSTTIFRASTDSAVNMCKKYSNLLLNFLTSLRSNWSSVHSSRVKKRKEKRERCFALCSPVDSTSLLSVLLVTECIFQIKSVLLAQHMLQIQLDTSLFEAHEILFVHTTLHEGETTMSKVVGISSTD